MALDRSALLELLEMMRSADAGELMRRLLGAMLQKLVDAEATAVIGAGPHQRTAATCASAAGRTSARSGLNARGGSDQEPTPNAWPPPVCGTAAMTHGSGRQRGDDAARRRWQSPGMSTATVYWRPGCPFCLKLRLGLRLTRTPHQLVNVREDPEASAFVKRHNGGDELVPTVAVGDRILTNPSVRQVQRALAGL